MATYKSNRYPATLATLTGANNFNYSNNTKRVSPGKSMRVSSGKSKRASPGKSVKYDDPPDVTFDEPVYKFANTHKTARSKKSYQHTMNPTVIKENGTYRYNDDIQEQMNDEFSNAGRLAGAYEPHFYSMAEMVDAIGFAGVSMLKLKSDAVREGDDYEPNSELNIDNNEYVFYVPKYFREKDSYKLPKGNSLPLKKNSKSKSKSKSKARRNSFFGKSNCPCSISGFGRSRKSRFGKSSFGSRKSSFGKCPSCNAPTHSFGSVQCQACGA